VTTFDYEASGYEARVTANLTPHWRLVANYSYTNSGRKNVGSELVAWYGLKTDNSGALRSGVTQDASGHFVVDPSAFQNGGAVAKWIELGAMTPAANPSSLTTTNGQTVAQEILNLVDSLNEAKEEGEKRWGLRPHKMSLFTAYDFDTGRLAGFTIGGGWRWRSANIIGADSRGNEITGRAIQATDLMLGYRRKLGRLRGQVRFQINIYNLLDRTEIIPVRYATSSAAPGGFVVPGGRGLAFARYDLVAPREIRFTTTYSF
jgi:outer membrane receptor for monomeric catechols